MVERYGDNNMTEKEKLYYLINGVLNGSYQIEVFCNEFTRIYNLEVDYSQLSKEENIEFSDLSDMAGRFSDNEENLKIPNMFFSKEDIWKKVAYVKKVLNM